MSKRSTLVLVGILLFILLVSIFFNINHYRELNNYETYTSTLLSNNIAMIANSSIKNGEIFDEILKEEEITLDQSAELRSNFDTISVRLQNIYQLNMELDKSDLKNKHFVKANSAASNSFFGFENKLKESDKQAINLDEDDLVGVSKAMRLTTVYIEAQSQNIRGVDQDGLTKVFDLQREQGVTLEDWMNYIEHIDQVTTSEYTYY